MGSANFIDKLKSRMWLRNLFLFAVPISLAILIIMLYDLSRTVESLSHSLIKRTTERVENELSDYFSPVINNLFMAKEWGKAGMLENLEPIEQNKRFIPFLRNYPQVSSMLISNTRGTEYMLLEEDSTWLNRSVFFSGEQKKIIRKRWRYDAQLNGEIKEQWEQTTPYESRIRPWFINALALTDEQYPAWTDPYIFFTTKDPGITISTRWKTNHDTTTHVIAFDIMLIDISRFTRQLDISKNGKGFILTKDFKVFGLPSAPHLQAPDSLKKYVLQPFDSIGVDELKTSVSLWNNDQDIKPFRFKYNDEDWWAGISKYYIGGNQAVYIGVMVPENDFLEEVHRTQTVIIAGFMLVIVLTLLVIRGYNQKKKDNVLLEKQKNEIEHQKKEITDSIEYAFRIQNAIIPAPETLKTYIPEHFILWKPRDIVSGDFYWAHEINGYSILVAADCTGHGVPGAFMSMLGISFLEQIMQEITEIDAADILFRLRACVIKALHQTGKQGEQKDGMDMAMCIIHPNKKTLQYAGANNPLYLIRHKETPELEEFKANKMPIGVHDRLSEKFNNHNIEMNPGDSIYIFSDGYVDQFGGPDFKKYKSKVLKEFLISIQMHSMETQREMLKNEIETWKGTNEQTDDILIIGIRF